MALSVGAVPPASYVQGDTVTWRLSSSSVTSAEATLKVRFSSPIHTAEVTATADGDGWIVALTPEQSEGLGAGVVKWSARAIYTVGGAVQTIAAGSITAVPLLPIGGGSGTQSHAGRMVALLEGQLEKLAADALEQYSIGERSATRRKMAEVRAELANAKRALAMEQNGGRLPSVRIVHPRLRGILK